MHNYLEKKNISLILNNFPVTNFFSELYEIFYKLKIYKNFIT